MPWQRRMTPRALAVLLKKPLHAIERDILLGKLPTPQYFAGMVFWQERMILEFLNIEKAPTKANPECANSDCLL